MIPLRGFLSDFFLSTPNQHNVALVVNRHTVFVNLALFQGHALAAYPTKPRYMCGNFRVLHDRSHVAVRGNCTGEGLLRNLAKLTAQGVRTLVDS